MTIDEIVESTISGIFTWTERPTLAYLCELAQTAQFIVESGCYMGASAFAMMQAAPDTAHMWTIDKFMVAGTEFVTRKNLERFISSGRLEIIVGDSERGGEMLVHMKGLVDVIFIDDGHAEEDLRRDIRSLFPLLKPGGVMCGHDWEGDNDVARGVKSMFNPGMIEVPLPRLWQVVRR